ncbi:glycoside hydrolase family 88 protein [Pontibacter beigongshangensis]|uniref:glycoside hydrolase family 88 protein n=1 Tax=Pontibacter beigongshangensis TaxID=2574733 RepID=UPI00164FE185|nr:glycoside hydrolase family 88 protein [Pontibacter beigongshangensis]
MKKSSKLILVLLVGVLGTVIAFAFGQKAKVPVKSAMQTVQTHLTNMTRTNTDLTRYPRSTAKDGTLATVTSDDWTSGFFPGSLWYMYEYTNDKKWETLAREWTAGLEQEQFNKTTHDLGFMLYCSFGNGYRLTKDPKYRDILIEGSNSLMSRFDERTGAIRSWDFFRDVWQFPVIIDNMMNLEMLYWASKETGNPAYAKVATTHAITTLENHFRPDYSSYHVIDYDTLSGKARAKQTHQGHADASSWARGQAWGLYGFTVAYRETKDDRFLKQAQGIADFFINHKNLPSDKIPYWDFDAPSRPDLPRDASAAAVAASGLLELSGYSGAKGEAYKKAASQMLASLASPAYLAKPNTNNNFVLMHSTGHMPGKSEIDVPINYADYYFIEGMVRLEQMNKEKKAAK